ncbi:FliM/FliN family flagellar motor C-terminal domain-containing protein [uncultured Legionella sp.]|uniref:FliM/FliN family flagellar motor C-terminal domain-containing protein n=1 Tax=uncultured Legionella sp. TaxID=210934 RepID=UPI002637243E|nr:FliM/FliN family flagellar motor C-terminal domain-containing protein [uncultured Legionella sp.]
MKPYRLINSHELKQLSLPIQELLDYWNSTYSLTPLTMELNLPPKEYFPEEQYLVSLDDTPLASINKNYIEVINQALFGINKPCLNAVSQELILILLNLILKTEHATIATESRSTQDWFYRGSTSLLLSLHTLTDHATIVLHPDWVYQNLPHSHTCPNDLKSLDDAVAKHRLSLSLELGSITLPLQQLVSLKAGDVIATDHPINSPLCLKQQDEVIAQAELGQSSQYKSIILKRFP